nr:MAG TPA: SprT-like domain-containing protein Spartan/DNA Complex repair, protease, DNA BINDING [Caudoviricetes sp.]
MMTKISSLLSIIEDIWSQLQVDRPDLPDAVFTIGSGAEPRGAMKAGHYAYHRWRIGDSGVAVCEIFIGGEGLKRGGRAVMATILHEATHALAQARGIRDTSDGGRYHNRRFMHLAMDEFGLVFPRGKEYKIGWSSGMIEDTNHTYDEHISRLDVMIGSERMYRIDDRETAGKPVAQKRSRSRWRCACNDKDRYITPNKAIIKAGGVCCAICGESFREDE